MNDLRNRRILVVDDSPAIHEDFHKILMAQGPSAASIDQQAATLFGGAQPRSDGLAFSLESAFQGEEALAKVKAAVHSGQPHAVAFVDMRMPPGWDGLETIGRLWNVYPDLETVICTAYSDHSWREIQHRLGICDRLLILKKPFDTIEVQQLALALTEKWNLRRLARLHTDGLADLVRQRTADMARTHQSKSELLARVSQELLIPMKHILDIAGALAGTASSPAQRELIGELQGAGDRLHGLLDDLLKFNTIESGKLQLDSVRCDLRAFCRVAVETHAARARAKGLQFDLCLDANLPVQAHGDPDHIRQVLALLLDNAITLTDRGAISVSIRRGMTPPNVEFAITDTGRGICADATLKYPSSLIDSALPPNTEGTGMGLTLAKQLIDVMDGWLEFDSKPGLGSTFRFTLPLAAAA
jgi:signal transduction histidine kinase